MTNGTIRTIGVLTSGGDAPGMNAAIRAVTRTGVDAGMKVFGIRGGYAGLLAGDAVPLGPREVGGIVQLGGTMLASSRSDEFMTEAGQQDAVQLLHRRGIDGLVIIGGNGSQTGALTLSRLGVPVVGIASTIDNDLYGVEISLGVDTALNIALEAIDRLKTTASSHHRAFLVEVMGRDSGYLATMAGLAGGAEAVVIPEVETHPEELGNEIRSAYERGKLHALIVVAEGASYDGMALAQYFKQHEERLGFDLRLTTLGHVQRGGAPTAFDRLLGTRSGYKAVQCMLAGEHGVLVGLRDGKLSTTPLVDVVGKTRTLDPGLLEMVRVLSR